MVRWIIILSIFPLLGLGQNTIGLPDISNYSKEIYKAGTQNWDIKQDKNGILYVANNEGLLSFDGKYWNLYPLPNKTIVRYIDINNENRIYAGGQDELGYFKANSKGTLEFISLTSNILKKDRAFGDVWDIVTYQSNVFFRTNNKIFRYDGKSIDVFNAATEWSFMAVSNNQLFAQDINNGLLVFENNNWVPVVTKNKLFALDPITSIISSKNDTTLITTLKNGVYKLANFEYYKISSPSLISIEQERIYAATYVNNNWMALATTIGGVYIINQDGEIIQHFSKNEGLHNNNVLCIYLDKQSNLWLGLDNGIACIAYNSSVKHVSTSTQDGSGYTALIHNNLLYMGTSGGLFSTPLDNNKDLSFSKGLFSQVANSTGQTWSISEINGQLLMGHHEGAYIIKNNEALPINSSRGYWNFIPTSNVFPSTEIIGGNYKGISFFKYEDNNFKPFDIIPNFEESSRYLQVDNSGNIWVSHPYHGVYKITKSEVAQYKTVLYSEKNGLPFLLNNHVFKIKNEIVVATQKGIYIYNSSKDRFEPSQYYYKLLGNKSIRYLKEDSDGNIWFIHEKNIGVIDMSLGEPNIYYLPELDNKMLSGFEMIYPVNANNIFLGGETGFYHINYDKYKKTKPLLKVSLREVKIFNQKDSLLFGGYYNNINEEQLQDKNNIPEINYTWRNIFFKFSCPLFGQASKLEYSYRLKGFDANWSEWSDKSEKEYTNIPYGKYSFEIKVRNNIANESIPISYSFIILPPWYFTSWAYFSYFLVFFIAIFYLYKRGKNKLIKQQVKYEEEQVKLQYLHQLEINKAENELMSLRNQKLQSDIDFKNSELATTAMHLVQKGELITKIKNELNHIIKSLDNEKAINEVKKMIKLLSDDDKMDKDWEHFTQHFDKVHSDFVVVLKEKHPNLSANETKLCTYLRMNLSTKEIAQLMNISVRGVEISRYRLRKKIGISTELSLFDYLINLSTKEH